MSTFPHTLSDGRSSGKAPEKLKFSQTCSLLSQFLKEKRISGDCSSGLFGKNKMDPKASTKDLLANMQNSKGGLRLNASAMESLPQLVENPCIKKSNTIKSMTPETPQLTIFYDGKMLVFDAFSPSNATEVMELATKLASKNRSTDENQPSAPITSHKNESKIPQTNTALETPRQGNQAKCSDLRYPRRASLLKFLEKRKERVISRGPYQINNPKNEGSSSGGEPKEQSSGQFDLNL